jgi:predicted dehydrogenase
MDKVMIKTIVIGYGHLGKWHTQKVLAHSNVAKLVAIVESFPPAILRAKEDHPLIKVIENYDSIIDQFDAAIVVTPTSTHFEIVKDLLVKNKHVFCEKPLCSNYEQVIKLQQLVGSKVLQVGHSERFHTIWPSLIEQLKHVQGPLEITLKRVASFKGRAVDVNVVQDLMIHDIDLCFYLFNKSIKTIAARGFKIRTSHYDYVRATLGLDDGSVVTIDAGRNSTEEERSLEIIGSFGCIKIDLFRNKYLYATNEIFSNNTYVEESSYEKNDHLFEEHRCFYESISQNLAPVVDYAAGAKVVKIIDQVMQALNSREIIYNE